MNCLTTKYDTVFRRAQCRDLRVFHNLSCSSLSHILHKAALSNFISFYFSTQCLHPGSQTALFNNQPLNLSARFTKIKTNL